MSIRSNPRESKRISELVIEYQNKGYQVLMPQRKEDVPIFLRKTKYLPDLIAKKKSEGLIIEVKSDTSRQSFEQLSKISGIVNAQKGWQFVLVLTNSKDPVAPKPIASITKVNELLAKSLAMGKKDKTHIEAAFLFSWAALEASLRLLLKEHGSSSSPWTLVRNAAMAGQLDRKDAQLLERLARVRNSILHGGNEASPDLSDVELLNRVVKETVLTSSSKRKAKKASAN